MPVIVLTNRYQAAPLAIVKNALPPAFELLMPDKAEKGELLKVAPAADYFLASGRIVIDAEILGAAPNLKMIQRTGVGLDTIDLAAANARSIPVYVNRGVNAASVAEHTVLLILAALRRLTQVDAAVKNGVWQKQEQGVRNAELRGKTVGLVGLGSIGRETAARLRAFGVNLVYYDVARLPAGEEEQLGVMCLPLEELLAAADIVSLHCPLTAETRLMMNAARLASMKRGSVLINTARGGLVDEKALAESLAAGHTGFAGLDVFGAEPLPEGSPLRNLPNVILTPHIGGITADSFRAMMTEAMENIRLFEAGDLEKINSKRIN